LKVSTQALVLGLAGVRLRATGRVREAVEATARGGDINLALRVWLNAAIGARNLSEVHLALGEIPAAIESALQAVDRADRSGDAGECSTERAVLANALHQSGRIDDAARWFIEAEAITKKAFPSEPLLHSLAGHTYCDLLLGHQDGATQVLSRAEQTLTIAKRNGWLLDIALDHLSIGRAHLLRASAGEPASRDLSRLYLDEAVAGLRRSGNQDHLPPGLIARASFFTLEADHARARTDLDEALELATRSELRLYEADAHLGYTRLYLATGDLTLARRHLARAREIISAIDYGRRKAESEDLTAQLEVAASRG
jgi:tetratricopeptide (TPR) repeat protein